MKLTRRPTDVEIRQHLREWFLHLQRKWKLNDQEMAEAVGISQTMVTTIKQVGDPGIDALVGLHYAFRESMSRMVSEDPPW
jgi:hypothetical protein